MDTYLLFIYFMHYILGINNKDYKLMCFNGKVKCSFVCSNRNLKDGLCVNFYDDKYSLSRRTTSSKSVMSLRPLTCHIPVIPGLIANLARWCSSYKFVSEMRGGRVPIIDISPPDVKIETTFFQRKFFITTPCNHPQKQHKKRTSDLSEVPILRCFLKILPLSAPLPASYQIPPDCTLNGIYPSNDTSFLYPIRTFSISFAALAHC